MASHNEFISVAIGCAKNAAKDGGYPFGAIVVKNNTIIGRSDVERPKFDPTAHAETTAIREACKHLKTHDLAGCVIYSSCYPCQMCLGAIKWSGIKEIYYTIDKKDSQTIGHFQEIFTDDMIELTKHKISDASALEYIRNWYDKKSHS